MLRSILEECMRREGISGDHANENEATTTSINPLKVMTAI